MIKDSFSSYTVRIISSEVVALEFINHFSCLKLDLAILSFMEPNHPHFLGIQFERRNFVYRRIATFWQKFPHGCFSKYYIPKLLKSSVSRYLPFLFPYSTLHYFSSLRSYHKVGSIIIYLEL